MERSRIVPHITWSGPHPEREEDAYLLAMLLRIYSTGLDTEDILERNTLMHPSVLTTENLHIISAMYAFYKGKMEAVDIKNTEDLLSLVKACGEEDVTEWIERNDDKIKKAEASLLEFVDTARYQGFRCFG